MFGYRASMDAYAGAVGDLIDEGEHFLELMRVGTFEGVRTCGYDVERILEGVDGDILFVEVIDGSRAKRQNHLAEDGVTLLAGSCHLDR